MNNVEELQSKTIDWLRFPLMVMVVMIHVSLCVNADYSLPTMNLTISAFIHYLFASGICFAAVPTFFFISGYLFFSGTIKDTSPSLSFYVTKLKKRVKSILIPLVIITATFLLIHYLIMIARAIHGGGAMPSFIDILNEHGWLRIFWDNNRLAEINSPARTNIIGVTMHSNFPMFSPMWYLRDLIVVMLLSPVVYYFVTKTKKVGLFIVAILYVLNIWIPVEGFSASAFFFFSLGAYYRINNKLFLDEFNKAKWVFYIIALVTLVLMFVFHGYNNQLEGIFVRAYIVAGVVCFINIASGIVARDKWKMPAVLTQSSFFVYLVHNLYLSAVVGYLVTKVLPPSNQALIILNYFVVVALTLFVSVMIYIIMKKICPKVLAVVSGGR